MAAFSNELKLMRELARRKYEEHKQSATVNTAHNETPIANIGDKMLLLRYSKKETISDQIKCNHSLHTKCIHCSFRNLLPFNKQQLSLKYGLFKLIFSHNKQCTLPNLIKICRSTKPKLIHKTQPLSSLQYGEILFYSFGHMLHQIHVLCPSFNHQNAIFIDFGSGIAKTLFVAALLYRFKQCIGIEIIHKLHQRAIQFKQNIPNQYHHLFECNPDKMCLLHGNVFDKQLLNKECFATDSDYVIFIASTAFNHSMMESLSSTLCDIFESMHHTAKNIWIITLSHPLPNKKSFVIKHQQQQRMSWGNVMVFFQSYKLNSV
eukprot:51883_1